MRTVIGWMAALFGSALLGATVYQTVLSKPLPELDPTATVETISSGTQPRADPCTGPRSARSSNPTPTVTVEDEVLIEEEVVQASQPRTPNPAPARTSAPKPQAHRATRTPTTRTATDRESR